MRKERFATSGLVRLAIRAPAGSVEIEAIEGLAEASISLSAHGGDREFVERSVIEARESDGGREILVQAPDTRLLGFIPFRTPEVDIRVRCPAGTELGIDVVSATVRARGRFGKTRVNGVSGDIALDRVGGDASIKTVSGDARVAEITGRATGQSVSGDLDAEHVGGAAELRTISGDFRLGRLDGPVTAQSVSGDIALGSVLRGEVTLKTVSGDIRVGVRKGSRLWVDARSIGGHTTSELPVSEEQPAGNGPYVELRATATSGDIRVVRGDLGGRKTSSGNESGADV